MIEATGHLLEAGHRRIAALTGPTARRGGRERLAGLAEAFRQRGLEEQPIPCVTAHNAQEAEQAVLSLVDGPQPPTAILAGGMQLLVGAMRALRQRSLTIGRDMALVGWDEAPLAEFLSPPIAVVDRDPHGLGIAAARRALTRLGQGGGNRDDGPPHADILPVRFVARQAFSPPRDHADKT
jgi:LacI family transcriptional regulator